MTAHITIICDVMWRFQASSTDNMKYKGENVTFTIFEDFYRGPTMLQTNDSSVWNTFSSCSIGTQKSQQCENVRGPWIDHPSI
jgi:hypothetical protein